MAIFDDLLAGVYSLTARPDLVAETQLAIRQATLAYHLKDLFSRDMVTGSLAPSLDVKHTFDFNTTFPRCRQFSYLRSGALFYEILRDPRELFDPYLNQRTQIAYVAGSNLVVLSRAAVSAFDFAYIAAPVVWPAASYDSWIAELYPEAIHVAAQAILYRGIGRVEEANALTKIQVAEWHAHILSNHLEGMAR